MMKFPAGTTFTPYSVFRNVSDASITLTPTVWWMDAAGPRSAQLAQISLSPHQTKSMDIVSLLAASGPKSFNGSFNLVFEGDFSYGELLIAGGSVDQTNTYVFEVIPHGIAESASKFLQYWSTGNGDDTMVTLWNPADEAQDFVFTLFYPSGHYDLPIHLDPRATRAFNMSEVVENQVPDKHGNVIPAPVHEGSAVISGDQAKNQHILIGIDYGVYNVRKATCGVGCITCDGVVNVFMDPNPFTLTVGDSIWESFYEERYTGAVYNFTDQSTWYSDTPSVAAVDKVGDVFWVGPGSPVIISAEDDNPEIFLHFKLLWERCSVPYHLLRCRGERHRPRHHADNQRHVSKRLERRKHDAGYLQRSVHWNQRSYTQF